MIIVRAVAAVVVLLVVITIVAAVLIAVVANIYVAFLSVEHPPHDSLKYST